MSAQHHGKSITRGFGSEETSTVSSARLKRKTECLRMPSFAVLSGFDMDRQKKEGEHGVTTVHTQEEFCTDKRHHTTIIAPGFQDFIKNTLQVDVAFTNGTADRKSEVAIVKNNHKAAEIQGVSQTASDDDQPLENEASP